MIFLTHYALANKLEPIIVQLNETHGSVGGCSEGHRFRPNAAYARLALAQAERTLGRCEQVIAHIAANKRFRILKRPSP